MDKFLLFIEIKTKTVSVLAFLLGTAYAASRYGLSAIDPLVAAVLFVAVLLFDATTTAVNNHVEYRHRLAQIARGETPHAPLRDYGMGKGGQLAAILLMLAGATAAGCWVAWHAGWVVLLTGVLCFGIGILYSAGPLPIIRTPFGEALSGFFMGVLIPFLAVYAQVHDPHPFLLRLTLDGDYLMLSTNLMESLPVLLLGIAPAAAIANVMLANNICDRETDLADRRYTLPVLVGPKASLRLFAALYVVAGLAFLVQAVSGWMTPWILLALVPGPWIVGGVRLFFAKQDKATTFPLSIRSLMLLMIPSILVFAADAVAKALL